MRPIGYIAACLLIVSGTVSTAQQPATCPWFSSGSAQTVLGGPASLHLHMEENGQGLCEFASQSGAPKILRILIGKVDKHVCPPESKELKALGNRAVQCRWADQRGNPWDVIEGRVRDVFFVVTTSNVPDALAIPAVEGHPADPYSASILERIAEQVVGNLD
ncbi:MAG: hypothetical protein WBX19_09605 [Terracidiphilus sp.]